MTVKTVKLNKLLVFIAITELAGLFGFLLGGSPKQSYAALVKPPAAPPGWLFSVVWVALYLLIGTAAYLFSGAGPGSGRGQYRCGKWGGFWAFDSDRLFRRCFCGLSGSGHCGDAQFHSHICASDRFPARTGAGGAVGGAGQADRQPAVFLCRLFCRCRLTEHFFLTIMTTR